MTAPVCQKPGCGSGRVIQRGAFWWCREHGPHSVGCRCDKCVTYLEPAAPARPEAESLPPCSDGRPVHDMQGQGICPNCGYAPVIAIPAPREPRQAEAQPEQESSLTSARKEWESFGPSAKEKPALVVLVLDHILDHLESQQPTARLDHRSTGAGGGDEDGYDMTGCSGPTTHRDVRNYLRALNPKHLGQTITATLLRYVDAQEAIEAKLQSALAEAERQRDELSDRLDAVNLDHEVTKGYRQHAEQQLAELPGGERPDYLRRSELAEALREQFGDELARLAYGAVLCGAMLKVADRLDGKAER